MIDEPNSITYYLNLNVVSSLNRQLIEYIYQSIVHCGFRQPNLATIFISD